MNSQVYLDYNATVPALPEVISAVARAMEKCGNASSVHTMGRQVRKLVEDARENLAALVGAKPAQVIFTGGGSEANNMALNCTCREAILVSAIEHVSVLNAIGNTRPVSVDRDGVLDLQALEFAFSLTNKPALVSVMLANNETGVIQPVADVARVAKEHGAIVHCDAIQALGKISVDWRELNVDFLSLSAHKIGGPQGVGALIVNENIPLDPFMKGGGQERGRRAGTENVAGIAGFGEAAKSAGATIDFQSEIKVWRNKIENEIKSIAPAAQIFGGSADRLPNTSCISMPCVSSETQLINFDLADIMVSAGSACSSGKVQASHVLTAMGVKEDASRTIRISLGAGNSENDADKFISVWRDMCAKSATSTAA